MIVPLDKVGADDTFGIADHPAIIQAARTLGPTSKRRTAPRDTAPAAPAADVSKTVKPAVPARVTQFLQRIYALQEQGDAAGRAKDFDTVRSTGVAMIQVGQDLIADVSVSKEDMQRLAATFTGRRLDLRLSRPAAGRLIDQKVRALVWDMNKVAANQHVTPW
jgi:hypothetical protein